MAIPMSAEPPFNWLSGTNLEDVYLASAHLCEAMQALKNRVEWISRSEDIPVTIPNWNAYDHEGDVIADLAQFPNDNDLSRDHDEEHPEIFSTAVRHVNHIEDLRTALEIVLPHYLDEPGGIPWTLSTLMQAAVGRSDYNVPEIGELAAAYGFDGEDVEELLKAIDLLVFTKYSVLIFVDGILRFKDNPILTGELRSDHLMLHRCASLGIDTNYTPAESGTSALTLLDTSGDLTFIFDESGDNSSEITDFSDAGITQIPTVDFCNNGDFNFSGKVNIVYDQAIVYNDPEHPGPPAGINRRVSAGMRIVPQTTLGPYFMELLITAGHSSGPPSYGGPPGYSLGVTGFPFYWVVNLPDPTWSLEVNVEIVLIGYPQ